MPNWKNLEEMMRKMIPVYTAFGPSKHRATPLFEDCVNYPIEQLVELSRIQRKIESHEYNDDTVREIAAFDQLMEQIAPVENPQPKIYLWDEKNIPTETDYTDNSNCRYNHDPDFKPYLFEMLLPEDVTPKGAVIICAGGDHGDAHLYEGYQSAKDMQAMGYQCFLLLNRTNHNPWTVREAGADAARAVRIVRAKAEQYRIRPDQIAYAGFSNGALTGEGMIENFSGDQAINEVFPTYIPDKLDTIDATPNAFLCIYGPRFKDSPFDWNRVVYPPTFIAVGLEDFAMENLKAMYPDLIAHDVPVELHTFSGTPHGQAGIKLLDGEVKFKNFELWLPLADSFLQHIF